MTAESTMQGLERTIRFLQAEGLSKERLKEKVAWIKKNYGLSDREASRLLDLVR